MKPIKLRKPSLPVILAAACSIVICLDVVWIALHIGAQFDHSYPEGSIVRQAYHVVEGENPYTDWREWPHHFAPYGPLTYYVPAFVARVTGNDDHPMRMYTVGRTVSGLFLLGVCVLIGMMTRTLGAGFAAIPPAILAFLAWSELHVFTISFRPDAAQVFFSLLGIYVMLRSKAGIGSAAVVLFALSASMWFKPMSWAAILVACGWIIRGLGPRKGGTALLVFAVVNLSAVWVWDRMCDGWFIRNLSASSHSALEPSTAWNFFLWMATIPEDYSEAGAFAPRIFLISGLAVAVGAVIRFGRDPRLGLLGAATLLSFAISDLAAIRRGSAVNYYLECYALASVGTGVLIDRVFRSLTGGPAAAGPTDSRMRRRTAVVAAIPLATALAFTLGRDIVKFPARHRLQSALQEPLPLSEVVRLIEGPILSIHPSRLPLEHPSPDTVMDFFQYKFLVMSGRIDPEILLGRVRRREFAAICRPGDAPGSRANSADWLSLVLDPVIEANYLPAVSRNGIVIMAPRAISESPADGR